MNIAICDDEIKELYKLKQIIENYNYERHKENFINIFLFENGNDLIDFLEKKNRIDLLFLDIMLPETNGIDIAKEIRTFDCSMKIIFITVSSDYAVDSYEVDACYYLLKPYSNNDINKLLDKVVNIYISDSTECFIIKQASNTIRIFYNNIIYVECLLHKLYYHLYNGNIVCCYNSIKDCSNKLLLKKYFVKCHKSYIVNMNYISEISNKDFVLFDKTLIPLSKKLFKEVSNIYINYILTKGHL